MPHALHYEDVAMEGMSERDVATLKDLLKLVYGNLANADARPSRATSGRARSAARPSKQAKRRVKASA